jgi:hypothetical protein
MDRNRRLRLDTARAAIVSLLLAIALPACGTSGNDTTGAAGATGGTAGTTGAAGATGGTVGVTGGAAGATGGGTGVTGGSCAPLASRVRATSFDLAAPMRSNDEYYPTPLAPLPGGGARLGWRAKDAKKIHVTNLDDGDRPTGELATWDGDEVHALLSLANGGAMIVVSNDPDIYSPKYCLSAATPDKAMCAKVDLVRFDAAGGTVFTTTLTNKKNVDSDGASFVWWYQHTARLAFANNTFAAYFRVAGSSPRPNVTGEIDIHAGDALKFVGASGQVSAGGWDWGCSHSWSVRLAYDGHWGAACHGDAYPNALRVAVLDQQATRGTALLHNNVDATKRALGGLVPAPGGGFWLSHIAPSAADATRLELHLVKVDDSGYAGSDQIIAAATTLDSAYPFRTWLAAYGTSHMLIAWRSTKPYVAVVDSTSGTLVDGPVAIDTDIDIFQEIVTYANGDAAWVYAPDAGTRVNVVRVAACGGV